MLLPLGPHPVRVVQDEPGVPLDGPDDPPADWFNFDNYVTAFTRGNMLPAFGNTVFIFGAAIVGTILIGAATAYALDRFRFAGRTTVLALFLLATLVPGVTTQVATFQIINGLGLYDSRFALILLFMGTDIISIYIFLQFMRASRSRWTRRR